MIKELLTSLNLFEAQKARATTRKNITCSNNIKPIERDVHLIPKFGFEKGIIF